MKTTLGINISHNCSIAILEDDNLVGYFEEERFIGSSDCKGFDPVAKPFSPLLCIKEKVKHVDHVGVASYDRRNNINEWNTWAEPIILNKLKRQLNFNDIFFEYEHHLYHAFCGAYLSKFDEGICLVMDGGGAKTLNDYPYHQEVESIYYFDKSKKFTCLYKHLTNVRFTFKDPSIERPPVFFTRDKVNYCVSSLLSSGIKFSDLTEQLGFGDGRHSGKTMGLAAYGNEHGYRPEDMAKRLQIETKNHTIDLIKKAMSYADTKNIILSGGYAMNCSNNYEYVKAFPQLNFFVDPIAHDGGTAVGVALKVGGLYVGA